MNDCELVHGAKLEALRRDIRDGLASGPAEPHDMEAVKTEARRQIRSVRK